MTRADLAEEFEIRRFGGFGTSLRCNPFMTVMRTAELGYLYDPSDIRDLPREWTFLVKLRRIQMASRS